ncbi:MAG: hypothetical protein BGO41_12335 [Clostridiales bacterium 38-18]|nr:MAG: hypothetical protein BGO41_12335 [Clostridiales bacterium 38-18]
MFNKCLRFLMLSIFIFALSLLLISCGKDVPSPSTSQDADTAVEGSENGSITEIPSGSITDTTDTTDSTNTESTETSAESTGTSDNKTNTDTTTNLPLYATPEDDNLGFDTYFSTTFSEYMKESPDFIGWFKVPGTNIDYPLVQGKDNDYYLRYDYKNSPDMDGSIYLDYKNSPNLYDTHNAIYGHYLFKGTMFHDLHQYKDEDFYNHHRYVVIVTSREAVLYELFAVQRVSAYNYYLSFNLDPGELVEYAKHFKRNSIFDDPLELPEDLSLLTLVTCTYEFDNARLLLHAYKKRTIPLSEISEWLSF